MLWLRGDRAGYGVAQRYCQKEAVSEPERARLCNELTHALLERETTFVGYRAGVRLAERLGWPVATVDTLKAELNAMSRAFDESAPLIGEAWSCDGAARMHTIILGHVGTLAVNPYAMKKHPYDVNKAFVPVSLLARVPNLFVVNAGVPAQNFREFVELAKKNPGKFNYGSAGNGSAGHLAMEYLKSVTGTFIVHIPYRGTGPQLQDLLAGRTEASSAGAPAMLPHIRSGKLRALAVGTSKRIPSLPDVPTVAEMGYPGFETSQWYGILAPAGTPKAIVDRLAAEADKALRSSAVTARFAADDAVAGGGTPEAFAEFIRNEQARWSDVVKRANIVIE